MADYDLVREMKKSILIWYAFPSDAKVFYYGGDDDPVADMLRDQVAVLCCAAEEESLGSGDGSFDYVVSVALPERSEHPAHVFASLKKYLKPTGRMLLAMNNRMGIRYYIGDRDPYTNRNFDGVENYRRAYNKPQDPFLGRCYDEVELRTMLADCGFHKLNFYSVISDLTEASMLFRGDYLPKEDLATRITPRYEFPDTIFLEEEGLYGGLIGNGLFHKLANAYLIECFDTGEASDVLQATVSMTRGKENALVTLLRTNQTVEKRAVYPEGRKRLVQIENHTGELKQRGIAVVDMTREDDRILMPFEKAEIAQVYLRRIVATDPELFLKEMDHFRDLILRSSEHIREDQGDGEGVLLKKGYIDMVPLNAFYKNGEFVFFDQEFAVDNYPANAVISRMVWTFYERNVELQKWYPTEKLLDRYGLTKYQDRWYRMDREFFKDILSREELDEERRNHRANGEAIASNRVRMNFTSDEYQKYFVDIFEHADEKKLVLFGSGVYAKRFIELYGSDYTVDGIIDNNRAKWGQELSGISIGSPDELLQGNPDEFKVLICIKNYAPVIRQMEKLGIRDYCVYDANRNYPRKRKPILSGQSVEHDSTQKKKYHVGYVAGVFDLFHIGHLNLLRRAKELCDYLIVGIVSDEGVSKNKQTETFIPFAERKELIASCRYVDEVVEVPPNYSSVRETFKLYHYDVQFSGNDHADDPVWLEEKAYLNKHGADIVFFPYTESTSSTKLKELIGKKLL